MGLALVAGVASAETADATLPTWTILVFMNGDNNLEKYAIEDFEEMSSAAASPDVRVLVQLDRGPGESTAYGDWTDTWRFEMRPGLLPVTDGGEAEPLGEVNMGDGAALSDFVAWGLARAPAKRTMLVIWDHGQGYKAPLPAFRSMSRDLPGLGRMSAERMLSVRGFPAEAGAPATMALEALDEAPSRPAVKSVSHDATSGDELLNAELAAAVHSALPTGRSVDVLGFDACLMAMVETAWALRGTANVLVGSEELEPGTGWDYTRLLNGLAATPEVSAAGVGALAVDAYSACYASTPTTTLSSVDIASAATVSRELSSLASILTAHLPDGRTWIAAARKRSRAFAPSYACEEVYVPMFPHVDVGRFCTALQEVGAPPDVQAQAERVKAALSTAVLRNWAHQSRQGLYGASGLAVFFPASLRDYQLNCFEEGYYDQSKPVPHPVAFVQDLEWDDFLHAYWQP